MVNFLCFDAVAIPKNGKDVMRITQKKKEVIPLER